MIGRTCRSPRPLRWTLGLTANWLVSLPLAAVLTHFYLNRVDTEEAMMVERFGDDYRSYAHRTGRLIPRLRDRTHR